MQQTVLDFTRENKPKTLFTERGKFDYTRSPKHAAAAYEKYHYRL
jgi:hypothetical protein